jgi:oxygen-independent coproporphyrinogen-3 oxidase
MAGIYIHIPFCKQACSYCDFHFSTNLKNRSRIVNAIVQEMNLRKNYLNGEIIETLYFGGGTPSLLTKQELYILIEEVHKLFTISNELEICLEANPDDLNKEKIIELNDVNINRLSIGVQSFHDKDLAFMNRAHNREEALSSIKQSQDLGINNLSIDLIFGGQTTNNLMWEENLETFFQLEVPHLSSYSLTVEDRTALHKAIKNGKINELDDGKAFEQYQILQDYIDDNKYEQYELSNYCKDKKYSKHNSSYWNRTKYLGLGPSAHSFNGNQREWNINNNSQYINLINSQKPFSEIENLTEKDQYHDYLITRLRTKWGINFDDLELLFSSKTTAHFHTNIKLLSSKNSIVNNNTLIVKRNYLFQSDEVIRQLWVD